jgi:hypothetical protein
MSVLLGAVGGIVVVLANRLLDLLFARRSERRALRGTARLCSDEFSQVQWILEFVKEHQAWAMSEWPDEWSEHRRIFSASGLKGEDWSTLQAARRATLDALRSRDVALQADREGRPREGFAGRDFAMIDEWLARLREGQAVLGQFL